MKKMKRLTALLCLLLALTPTLLHAQVVDVCAGDGTDSVTLYVNNYHYGIIQWQYSSDTVHWNDISDAHDTVYRFLPKEELYYRARMQYPNCPIDSSQITHIQLSPIANAGPDRILNAGYVIHLHANAVENARCMWQVIEGDYANLEDPTWRNSAFSGPDTLYRLTWTVANACGVSVDTVEIRYVVSRFYDAIVIVDTTDLILSDSSERANGVYRIVFNDPVPNVTDSTILVGIPDGGFLRRVVYFENHGDTCEMFTSQATMDDILEEGVIHFDADVAFQTTATRGNGNYVRIDHVPTRAEILTDSIYQSGKICFYEYPITLNGEPLRRSRDLGELQYNWTLPHLTLHGEFNIDDIDVDFNPNPIWEFHKNSWRDGFNFGLYDASATIKFKLHINSSVVFKPIKRDFGELTTRFVFVVFGVPVEAKAAFCMTARGGMNVSLTSATTLDMEIGSGLFTAAIEYNGSVVELKPLGKLRPVCRVLNESDILKIDGELFFEIGPKFDLHFYEILGPYVDVLNRLSFKLCRPLSGTDHQPFVTWGDRWVGDIGVNVEIPIVEKNLLDIKYRFKPDAWANIHKIPCKIERASNMNLHFNSGNWLTEPIQVKVWANGGNLLGVQPANNVKVKFQTSNGMLAAQPSGTGVTSTYVATDNNGIAQIYWKPSSNQINRLSAILNDCDGNPIEDSPINFYAYNGPDCSQSTLSLEVEKKNDGSVALKVSRDPESSFYWYSNGLGPDEPVTFPNFTAPITLIPGKTYYVRDDNNCVASATYHVMTPTSAECDLLLLYNIVGTSVNAMVLNGSAPYHFYVDYADNVGTGIPAVDITPLGTDYLNCTWNQGIPGHSYKMFVTDANGCSDTVEFSILDPVTTPFVVTNAAYNDQKQIYDTIMGVVVDDGSSPILSRGVEWSLSPDMANASNVWSPFSDDGMGAYTCAIPSAVATPGTTYYACAYATNSKGTAYGDTISITVPGSTPGPGSTTSCGVSSVRANETGSNGTITAVRDHQNNTYAVVQIGNQCWLKENMRCTTSPSTGANIVENPAVGSNVSEIERRAYYYDNNPANAANGYGLLYNWPAAMDGSTAAGARGICPEGWHLPTDAEWTTLMNTAVSVHQPGVTPSPAFGSIEGDEGENTYVPQMLSDNSASSLAELRSMVNSAYQLGYISVDEYNEYVYRLNSSLGNVTGFSSVHAGNGIPVSDGSGYVDLYFEGRNNVVAYWSSSPFYNYDGDAWDREWSYIYTAVYRGPSPRVCPISVRCLRNSESGDTPTPPTPTTTSCGVSSIRSNETGSNGTITAVRDHQNNSYSVVQIGGQCWLKENMRCTTSPTTGANIVQNPASGSSSTVRRAYYYDNNPSNAANGCGLLYNWFAAVDGLDVESSRGICPEGWHVPTDAEWTTMMNAAVSIYQPGTTPNPEFGSLNMNSEFEGINTLISQLLSDSSRAKWTNLLAMIELYYQEGYMTADTYNGYMNYFLNPNFLGNATGFSAFPAGLYSSSNFSQDRGASFWSSSQSSSQYGSRVWTREFYYIMPGVQRWAQDKGIAMSVRCLRNSDGYVMPTGDGYPCQNAPTVTDIDNNTYFTVQIGNQCWMKENLRTTRYSDGTNIPEGDTNSYSQPHRYFPNEDEDNVETYGYLYNWSAVMHGSSSSATIPSGVQGVCPTGWHVPSSAEWMQLTNYVENQSQYICGTANTNIAKALASTEGWRSSSGDDCLVGYVQADNNATGFSSFPAGRYSEGIEYADFRHRAHFWSSTEGNVNTARGLYLYYQSASVTYQTGNKNDARSVRCLRNADNGDTPNPPSPSNTTTSCRVSSIRSNETGSSDTITAVQDHENNSYAVVQIGNQCWLKENLRTTTSPSTNYTYLGMEAYWYNNDSITYAPMNYGLLYSWSAAMDGDTMEGARGICPEGWHIPTDAEWTAMTDYVSGQSEYLCDFNTDYIAKALADSVGWNNSIGSCVVGNDQSANNATGFSAVPAGRNYYGLSFGYASNTAYFWSSSQEESDLRYAYNCCLNYTDANVNRQFSIKGFRFSVRCLRD